MGQGRRLRASQQVHAWLRDHGSLTAAIVAHCDGQFGVELMHQSMRKPLPSERHLLGIRRDELAIVREVKLMCGDQVWVFARTVIPVTSLKGRARHLAFLGNKPLGAVLFSSPRTQRSRVEIARLDKRHALYGPATSHTQLKVDDLWGRRTLFVYEGKPLLVNEIFLPEIPQR